MRRLAVHSWKSASLRSASLCGASMPAAAHDAASVASPGSSTSTDLPSVATAWAIDNPITPPPTTITSRIVSFYMIWRWLHSCYSSVLAMSIRSRQTFQQLVTLPDGAIPLAEAALLMACEEYPQLTIEPYLDQLDSIAGQVKSLLHANDSPMDIAAKISGVL